MKKIILASLIIMLLILSFAGLYVSNQSNREDVLTILEEDYQFCEVIKKTGDDYWLICNGRPFFASYKNENLEYDLNGWSFLKNEDVWEELNNCEFYKSERNERDIEMIFYCNIKSSKPKAKKLLFDLTSLKTTKIEEIDFLSVYLEDLKIVYPNLADCEILNLDYILDDYSGTYKIYSNCNGKITTLYTDFDKLIPIIEKEVFSFPNERAIYSFNKLFGDDCFLGMITVDEEFNHVNITSSCPELGFDVWAEYFFPPQAYIWSYNLVGKEENLEENIINNLLHKFILHPPVADTYEYKGSYKNDFPEYTVNVYKIGDEAIKFFEMEDKIFLIERVCNRMVCL